jgi:hypothetical protein
MTVRSKQLLFPLNIQVTPYVFNAFVFQNLLDQKFFETYGRKDEKLISLMTNKLWSFFVTLEHPVYLFRFAWLRKAIEVSLQPCAYMGKAHNFFLVIYLSR